MAKKKKVVITVDKDIEEVYNLDGQLLEGTKWGDKMTNAPSIEAAIGDVMQN